MHATFRTPVSLRRLRDAVAGSDPGLLRLHQASGAAGAMATGLGVEALVAHLRGADSAASLVAMLLGAIVSMMGAMALSGTGHLRKARTAAGFPVAIGSGLVLGVAVTTDLPELMVPTFVAVMFVAVFVRRFGIPFFFYGFMLWIGYFFAALLHATWSMVPWLLADTVIAAAWVLLLSVSVLDTDPRHTLRRVRKGYGARTRRLTATLTTLLVADHDPTGRIRTLRRLRRQQSRLAEASLMIEAWSAEDSSLPDGWSPQALRRRVLDVQLAVDSIVAACEALTTPVVRREAARVTHLLSLAAHAETRDAVRRLEALELTTDGTVDAAAVRHLVTAVDAYLDQIASVDSPPSAEPGDFVPSVSLAMGNLPGSASVAGDVAARGRGWNPLSRLDFTTRQAAQAALAGAIAILLGQQLDSVRYYWAAIAAFIAFTGTGTRAETFIKAGNRVLGTLAGLGFGLALAHATEGHTGWMLTVIVASMFCGFYLVRINYAYMIFFVTIMVAQLYAALHELTDHLLVLRLEETAIGAAAGIAVGLLVSPLSTRDTVRAAQRDLLTALGTLLGTIGGTPPTEGPADLDSQVRDVDNRLRQLTLVSLPLTRPLLMANSPRDARHRIALYGHVARAALALARSTSAELAAVRETSLRLGEAARLLAASPGPLGADPAAPSDALAAALHEADEVLYGSAMARGSRRSLAQLHDVLAELSGSREADSGSTAARITSGIGVVRRTGPVLSTYTCTNRPSAEATSPGPLSGP